MRAPSERHRAPADRPAPPVHGRWRRAVRDRRAGVLAALALLLTSGAALAEGADSTVIPLGETGVLDVSRAPLEGDWVVVAVTGDATWRPQGDPRWRTIAIGRVVPAPSEIETGPTGGVTLVLGGDRLVVAPSSRLILMARGRGQDQRLRQERGRLRVDIEPRPGRDVEVRTPLLSLGIKGTSFEVAVDQWQSSVVVLEGRVTVTTPDGAPVQLGPRQGLSQPADPSLPARPLELIDLLPVSRTAPVSWYLAAPAAPTPGSPSVTGGAQPSTAQAPGSNLPRLPGASVPGPSAVQTRPPAHTAVSWLADDRVVVTLVLVAAFALALLIVPGLVLGQNLRQQWLDRPTDRGKRRRSLIRGW